MKGFLDFFRDGKPENPEHLVGASVVGVGLLIALNEINFSMLMAVAKQHYEPHYGLVGELLTIGGALLVGADMLYRNRQKNGKDQ